MSVADSGDGVQTTDAELIFAHGYSTARSAVSVSGAGLGEGLGLALSRQIARLGGGGVWLISGGSATRPEHSATRPEPAGTGAVFGARLERVLEGGRSIHG